jgi:HlyD family secretion protein
MSASAGSRGGAIAIIWGVLTPGQRRRFILLQFVLVLMAASTVCGLAAIMTFLALLADPALIDQHAALAWLSQMLGTSRRDFMLVVGGGFALLLLATAVLNVLGLRAMGLFAFSVGDRIRQVLFAEYLRRDYLFHVRAGAAQLMDNVLHQADRLSVTLLNAQVLTTNAVLTLLVVISLAVVNPVVALCGVLAVGGIYLLFFQFIRRRIARNGQLQSQLSVERVAIVEQALRGIKSVLISRAQETFSRRFVTVTSSLSHACGDTQFIGQAPRYVLESLAGIALVACAAYVSRGAVDGLWLAQLSFIGFAGFRLLPAIQQVYNAFVLVRANRPAVDTLASQLAALPLARAAPPPVKARPVLQRSIELRDLSFRYEPQSPLVVSAVNLSIPAGQAIGVVGASGCGKTTLIDLIVGILSPVAGRIVIDDQLLDDSGLPAWQKSIGYVPQEVVILDASVRENIAFGEDPEAIDDARVCEVARLAGASDFIEALPETYQARLSGMNGSLSGGQRQRIGIARALYGRPALLVLDEATNALDADTERAIIDAVVRNRGSCTLLIVAHGAATIGACDRVYELRDGDLRQRAWPVAHAPKLERAV